MDGTTAKGVVVQRAGFDFTGKIRALCVDISSRLDEFSHVDMTRVAVRFCQTRRAGRFGVQASLTPLRFAGGATESVRRGRVWTVQKVVDLDGREMLYLLSFYVPRFLDLPFEEKLATICHELWHIGPAFDGDLRRHAGRCYAHGRSEKQFHAEMQVLANRWLQRSPTDDLYAFLRLRFAELQRQHGPIFGTRIATPKLLRKPAGR